jgi:ubiquinone/menaquinone biosynthesis C-methylase UbiE
MYKNKIYLNCYISQSVNYITKNKSYKEKYDYIYYLIRFCFTDWSLEKSKKLSKNIIDKIIDQKCDNEIYKLVIDEIKLLEKSNIIGYGMNANEYNLLKIKNMEDVITEKIFKKIKNMICVDIGAGDCTLTHLVAEYNNMYPMAVDIKNDLNWSSSFETNKCKLVNHYYYNGNNLIETIKKYSPNKLIGLIMYNHSLHHFGSLENITNSLKESYKLLKKGGVLFIREHDNNNDNIYINLLHIFLALRNIIEHNLNRIDIIYNYMEYFTTTYTSIFFSKKYIINLCESLGFKLINYKKTNFKYINYKDISKTTLYAFIKN